MTSDFEDLNPMNMRDVVIKVRAKTVLSHEELKDVQSIVFGCVRRKDSLARSSRYTIKKEMPKWVGHDVRGTIEVVEVKVVGKSRSAKARSSKTKSSKSGGRSRALRATKRRAKARSARKPRATVAAAAQAS